MDIAKYLSRCAAIEQGQLKKILEDKKSHYNIYSIKQGKKERTICAPDELLTSLQRALKPIYTAPRVSKAVAAYEIGCSTANNALRHSYGEHLLHADIKSFFPSINKNLFMGVYAKEYGQKDAELLWDIASLDGGLPVGSCTSPFIANRIMLPIDKKLKKIKFGIKYTRYADDMVFSSKKVLNKELVAKIAAILSTVGLKLNDKKTYFMSARKQVNGVLVHDGKLSLGTHYKKQLKQQVYNILTKGQGNFRKIAGKLAYLKVIEPCYAQVMLRKYRELDNIGLFQRSGYYKNHIIEPYVKNQKII